MRKVGEGSMMDRYSCKFFAYVKKSVQSKKPADNKFLRFRSREIPRYTVQNAGCLLQSQVVEIHPT